MAQETNSPVCLQEQERNRDWLTALAPLLLLGVCYFRWSVLALVLVGTAAYMAVAALVDRRELMFRRLEPALVTGLLVTFCLPATAPIWTTAIGGGVAALLTAGVDWAGKRWHWATAPVCPALAGYLLVRYLFPASVSVYVLPSQWASVDAVAGATPLDALTDGGAYEATGRLLTGIHGGAIGEGCALVLLMAAGYLLLRRRLRWIAPVVMLLTVSGLSWLVWDAPLYSLLCGGVLLGALLLADRVYAPASYLGQAATGLLCGGVTVLMRYATGTDGTAVGVLIACIFGCLWGLAVRRFCTRAAAKEENFAKTENKC